MITAASTLAFMPLVDPVTALYPGLSAYWLLLVVPLVLVISVVYKGTRIDKLSKLPWAAAMMSVQILVVMAVASVLLDLVCLAMTRWF